MWKINVHSWAICRTTNVHCENSSFGKNPYVLRSGVSGKKVHFHSAGTAIYVLYFVLTPNHPWANLKILIWNSKRLNLPITHHVYVDWRKAVSAFLHSLSHEPYRLRIFLIFCSLLWWIWLFWSKKQRGREPETDLEKMTRLRNGDEFLQ